MIIKVDEEGSKLLMVIADAALKGNGMNAIDVVTRLRQTVVIEETKPKTQKVEKPKKD